MPRCTPAMAAGSGLFDSGPVVARYSLSTDVRPLRGALSQFEEIWTKAATLVSTTGRVLNGATWSLAGRGQRS